MASVALIDIDPQLAAELPSGDVELARRALIAPAMRLRHGPWDASGLLRHGHGSLGLLVVDGLLVRSTTLGGRVTAHLFGDGDVVRPWTEEDLGVPGTATVSWAALGPCVVALLDRRLITLAARWPAVLAELARRTDAQMSRLSLQVAIARIPRIDDRLLLLFWRLGERWGRMTPNGVLVPVPLTHETIASLVAASRPPVSSALAQLSRQGLLRRVPDGWLLDRAAEQHLTEAFDADHPAVAAS